MNELDAVYAFLVAAVVAGIAHAAGGAPRRARGRRGSSPRARALGAKTPLLGGLAILAGVLAAGALFLPGDDQTHAILAAAALITAVGRSMTPSTCRPRSSSSARLAGR